MARDRPEEIDRITEGQRRRIGELCKQLGVSVPEITSRAGANLTIRNLAKQMARR